MWVGDCQGSKVKLHRRKTRNEQERPAAVRGAERPVRLNTGIEVEPVGSLRLHELQSRAEGDFRPC